MPTHSLSTSNPRTISPQNSSTPLITQEQRQDVREASASSVAEQDGKTLKQRLLGLAGKKKDEKAEPKMNTVHSQAEVASPSKQAQLDPKAQKALRNNPLQNTIAASPSRVRSSSPRLHSPASSEIFERNVQEPIPISSLGKDEKNLEQHLPAHVITEDAIPPALEASAEAITNNRLNPDEVEIVTSASHQPAAQVVLEAATSNTDLTSLNSPRSELIDLAISEPSSSLHATGIIPGTEDDNASTYAQLDPNDVRRLSFISFKDIVHSEHQQMAASSFSEVGSREGLPISNMSASIGERAASPLRSPRSPNSTHSSKGGLTTPPPGTNANPLTVNPEQSPVRSIGLGSPGNQHGELTIETMRQSIRKTASGDLGGGRSTGMSPISDENSFSPVPRSRTNS
ncbi:uncharacterized protein MYCFIDRAFT_58254 [Pseudocercospora fijiensis CIRAD86]|uniref:Uncharacterized protein n=1 Tax=Pseudocercospora fijiensis (strain CIRAD86) TaxID=383855 RepID=M2ZUZ3_PSEFD|nr:uncharacterized protein MYCFIDRAFT_58254 [Pseudocercospora fijiensis CIRAD86]EME82814.1 hypothetical protein MYCFIDRAFT_58254 [Pseudocercospora fijiensis CIRAD86]